MKPVGNGVQERAAGRANGASSQKAKREWDAEYRRQRHIFVRLARPRILALSRSFTDPRHRAAWLNLCSRAAFSVLLECGAYRPALVRTSVGWSTTVPSDPVWLDSKPIVFSPAAYHAAAEIALEGSAGAHLPEPVIPETFGDLLLFHDLAHDILSRSRPDEWQAQIVSPLTELLLPVPQSHSGKSYETLLSESSFGFISRGLSREWLNLMDALVDGDPAVTVPVLQNLSSSMATLRSLIPRDGWLFLLPYLWFYSDLLTWHSEDALVSALSRSVDAWRKAQQAKLEASQTAFRAVSGIFAPAVSTTSWQSLADIAEDGLATPLPYREAPLRAFLEDFPAFASVEGAIVQTYRRFSRAFA
jgi:hypothetical protein